MATRVRTLAATVTYATKLLIVQYTEPNGQFLEKRRKDHYTMFLLRETIKYGTSIVRILYSKTPFLFVKNPLRNPFDQQILSRRHSLIPHENEVEEGV